MAEAESREGSNGRLDLELGRGVLVLTVLSQLRTGDLEPGLTTERRTEPAVTFRGSTLDSTGHGAQLRPLTGESP